MHLDAQIDSLRTTLRTLFPVPGEVAELRLLVRGRKGGSSLYFPTDDAGLQDMAEQAAVADEDGKHNLYFGLNPRVSGLLGTGQSGKAEHVTRRRWFLVDADPTRHPDHKDDAASDTEKAHAKAAIKEVVAWLCKEHGWPVPALVCDSGNGWHALWAVDLEPESTLLAKVLAVLHDRFSTPQCKIDIALHDAPRICRLYGTLNRKGVASGERPHRRSRVIATRERVVVSPTQLKAVAGQPKRNVKPANRPKQKTKDKDKTKDADPVALARVWVAEQEPAVSGEAGHKPTFAVACGLVRDWGLSVELARPLLEEYSARCDPPYVPATRAAPDVYAHEMTLEQHGQLLQRLSRVKGKFLLSGYDHWLYQAAAERWGWDCHRFGIANHSAGVVPGKSKRRMEECIWCNFSCPAAGGVRGSQISGTHPDSLSQCENG